MSTRFSLSRKVATSTGTCRKTAPVLSLHRLFFEDAHRCAAPTTGAADVAGAVAARAGDVAGFGERGRRRWRDSSSRPKRLILPVWTRARSWRRRRAGGSRPRAGSGRFHVDEVDDDEAARGRAGGAGGRSRRPPCSWCGRRFLDVRAPGGAAGVDVDRHQRLGMVDHDGAARGQVHLARIGRLDLVLDLEAREQRHVVL